MANYTTRTRKSKVIHEVVLPNPTNYVELDKAMRAAVQGWGSLFGGNFYDDSIKIRATEEEIIIYYEGPEEP